MQLDDWLKDGGIDFELTIVTFFLFGFYGPMHSRIVHSYGNATIAGEGLQMLIYARHSWTLSWKSSLTWHTYCYRGLSFIMVIFEEPWHTRFRAFCSGAVTTCFLRLRSVATGDRFSIICKRGVLSTFTPPLLHLEWLSSKRFKYHVFQMNIVHNKKNPCLRTEKKKYED